MENQAFDPNLDVAQATQAFNDPNCAITINNVGPINYYHVPSPANIQDANEAIAQLTFEDIWRLPPFRISIGSVRLDVLGVIAGGGRNWQILINGPSTISAITVQGNLATASTQERQEYVQRMVRIALVQSLNIARTMDVNGPCR